MVRGQRMRLWAVACLAVCLVAPLIGQQQPATRDPGGRRRSAATTPLPQAQRVSIEQAEDDARQLVVMIESAFADDKSIGAGIIFDRRPDSLYIVTALHVVRNSGNSASDIRVQVRMVPGERFAARLLDAYPERDLAVLRVDGVSAFERDLGSLRLDRLGDVNAVKVRDEVFTVGQPNGTAWDFSVGGDVVTRIEPLAFAFRSGSVAPGSSGGALFDAQRLLIGLVQKDVPPAAEAMRIDVVMRVLADKYSVKWLSPRDDSGSAPEPAGTSTVPPAQPAPPYAGSRVWIVNGLSRLCLTVAGGVATRNAVAVQYPCDEDPSRVWTFVPLEGSRAFHVRNAHSGLCLTIAGGVTDRNTAAVQYPCDEDPSRRWMYRRLEEKTFRLINVHSGLCLTIAGGGTERNTAAVQFPCDGDPSRDWEVRLAR